MFQNINDRILFLYFVLLKLKGKYNFKFIYFSCLVATIFFLYQIIYKEKLDYFSPHSYIFNVQLSIFFLNKSNMKKC